MVDLYLGVSIAYLLIAEQTGLLGLALAATRLASLPEGDAALSA